MQGMLSGWKPVCPATYLNRSSANFVQNREFVKLYDVSMDSRLCLEAIRTKKIGWTFRSTR